ncbi:COP9 signalosome complex subunit 4 [Nowakowskiella sp. JEL0407]|nr:COP9 signalosome complex subunit 4 [Nowakowskiella sp. JEL0407]
MATVNERLVAASNGAQKDRAALFNQILLEILSSASKPPNDATVKNIKEYLTHSIQESLGLVVSRQLLNDFITAFDDWSKDVDSEVVQDIWSFLLEKTQSRVAAFEEQISLVREKLAAILENDENWTEAAKILQGIPLDSGHRTISDDYKLRIYLHIARLLLEDEDATMAETYLSRASLLIPTTKELVIQLQYKFAQGRIADYKRQFLVAAAKYNELSYVVEMADSERVACLVNAVTCAVLASAGPQRSRMLATLYKDERVRERQEFKDVGVYAILEKVFLERVLRKHEVEEFAKSLKSHQMARLGDGTTVLERAVIEHNLLSASRLYNNIRFDELGALLGIGEEQAEGVAVRMVGEGRLVASIDQIERLIYFRVGKVGVSWDHQIVSLCHHVDAIIDSVQLK